MFQELHNYLPEPSLPIIEKWFADYSFNLKITKKRQTKLGDFRVKHRSVKHQITVNGNLNPYSFLITLTHEFAHLLVWENYKKRLQPHGSEWKNQFSALLMELIINQVFPEDIKNVLIEHAKNPAASSVRDVALTVVLNKYNPEKEIIYLSEIPLGAHFSIHNKRVFAKGEKRRTRYLCKEIASNKQYLVHGSAEVVLVDN
ncbi:SprT-like domain-containing protein [Vicingus serpentipes]|uniref:SprT-like domain-containing protein n=1 Tax=Vicingus serpentipes TaxID=1926625 RepID=UPI001476C32B|nr:SprT-like domain-containing protein [Vicingus serpentipes]